MYLSFVIVPISRLKVWKVPGFPFLRSYHGETKMSILNVAEKNNTAKHIAALLSGGTATKRDGLSTQNKIYEFECEVFGQKNRMVMTSVSGHLLELDFRDDYLAWNNINPAALFKAPIVTKVHADNLRIKKTLEREVKNCSKLIIWTDCDREGENIGFQIISVCKAQARNIQIYRAKFSELTAQAVRKAIRNLGQPNSDINNAVNVRKEFDLRIGAVFTRFQTLFLQQAFPNALKHNLISYGSCQFPTLGFVVERFKAISEFQPELFWQLKVKHTINDVSVEFHWARNRLFEKLACQVLYEKCAESGTAKVEKVETKPQVKWRPRPLDTVTLEKMASKKLKISAKETLKIAENLYTQGLISYPRTETNFFSKDINLAQLVEHQTESTQWGDFARKVLTDGPNPFQGKKSDQAHPPIHPLKFTNTLRGNDGKIYEFIVRHFLACLSKNAEGLETKVHIDIAEEKFSAKGLVVTARNYLEVYPYDKWSDKEIHAYKLEEVFKPELSMEEGETTPPSLLTEADLIALMEKHGIGTDATHADHIETIKARLYVGIQDEKYFVPRTLGMGLVEGYNNMGYGMAKPELRAELEADLQRICDKEQSPTEVLSKHIEKYETVYEGIQRKTNHLVTAIQNYIEVEPTPVNADCLIENLPQKLGTCPSCRSNLVLQNKKNGGKYIRCLSSECNAVFWLPSFVREVSETEDSCPTCGPNTRLIQFKFKKGSCPYPHEHVGCIGGCDRDLLNVLNFKESDNSKDTGSKKSQSTRRNRTTWSPPKTNDSGFVSLSESSPMRESGASPTCHCGAPAKLTTVKKQGPNQGRLFYSCASSGKCNYFQWKDKPTQAQRERSVKRDVRVSDDSEEMRCYCSKPCRRVTAMKDGPNKGREFYTCGKPYNESDKCNFFKWVDGNKNYSPIDRRIGRGQNDKYRWQR